MPMLDMIGRGRGYVVGIAQRGFGPPRNYLFGLRIGLGLRLVLWPERKSPQQDRIYKDKTYSKARVNLKVRVSYQLEAP
jgi:hypothetical protein